MKGPWCNWSRLNGFLKHGKGGVTRCPAMMSSIGALCGSQDCHSFITPGVCFCMSACVLLVTPFPKSNSKILVGWDSHTNMRKPPTSSSHGYATVTLKKSASSSSEISARPLIPHTTHIHSHPYPVVGTHPLKNPQTINFISMVHKSPPTRLLLQGETFPRKGEKHLAVKFLFFSLHFSPSLYSISMSENKQLTVNSVENRCIASHHTDPLFPCF